MDQPQSARERAALRWAWLDSVAFDPDLSPIAVRVAYAIAWHLFGKDHSWPSQETIAAKIGASPRSVWSAINELAKSGRLIVHRRDLGCRKDGRPVAGGRV